ncbi:MAG TPA: hypothetical protein VK869_01235 [Rubrobacteraceae bacterium]|nr:hypothetical protein [Rubrobacteraceae bacterium]
MTLVRVNAAASGSEFSILNLQMITRVDCRNFAGEREERQATVFFADGGNMALAGVDADRVVNSLEELVHYPR